MIVEWPKKKTEDTDTHNELSRNRGWNACHDAFMKVIESQPALVPLDEKRITELLKSILLSPKPKEKPTLEELEKILNSSEGQSLGILPNGEIATIRPSFSMEYISRAICSTFGQSKERLVKEGEYRIIESLDGISVGLGSNPITPIQFMTMENAILICDALNSIPPQRDEVTVEEILDAMMSVYHNEDLKPLLRENSRLSAKAIHDRIYGGK